MTPRFIFFSAQARPPPPPSALWARPNTSTRSKPPSTPDASPPMPARSKSITRPYRALLPTPREGHGSPFPISFFPCT
eukprot:scaffold29582_cov62-Isochrysis_galbana.AAC.1